ncbi:hypothetical protein [Micromonospora sp. NPDC048839]|uniref:hypothetical protein n=1 Tax=Micromonospora sp. NPDC048839 TaxID=3155641 RepID=UPI0033D5D8D1
MQDQTVPQSFLVTFDPLAGVDPLKIPAPAKTSEIADRIQEAFDAIDITVGEIDINLTAGTVAVEDTDGDVIERARIEGAGVGPAPEPDYWLTLADDLRQAADLLATLAGTTAPVKATLDITGAYPGNTDRSASALTDAAAVAFGVSAFSHTFPAGDSVYKADRNFAKLHAHIGTYMPPEQSELERLRAENALLQAQLAEGGATR